MLSLLKLLEQTGSRNEKESILKSLTGEQEQNFKRIAHLTYSPSINFYIKDYEKPKSENILVCNTLMEALNDLENIIASRSLTGNNARKWITMTLESLSEEDTEVMMRVIKRDLRCGVSASTINKIWPNTIYVHPYMRCSSFSEKNLTNISFPCLSQTKMDGLYCDIIPLNSKIELRSRNGSFLTHLVKGNEDFEDLHLWLDDFVLMGELMSLDENGALMVREDSNGYLNSDNVDPNRVVMYAWDLVPKEDFDKGLCKVPYKSRLKTLSKLLGSLNRSSMRLVDSVECNSKEDVIEHFKLNREKGEEGTVIKDYSMQWKPGTSKKQVKCKVIFDFDLKIVDWKYGEKGTKYEEMVGSIKLQSSCGLLEVWVGSGLKDHERQSFVYLLDKWVEEGKIVKGRGNDVITNESDPNKWSIFLPRFVEVRNDKTEADSKDRCIEQVKAFTNLLDCIN